MPIKLYHGTSAAALADIAANGIKPRGKDGKRDNWKHTVGSNKSCVYLTDSYAFYFAYCAAQEGEDLALIEVDVDHVWLQADEDALEQGLRGHDNLPADWDMKRRTIYYRSRAHLYSGSISLEALGTCGHRGIIQPSQLRRVVTVKAEQVIGLVLGAFDPVISLLNYKLLGARYRQGVRWFFGDEPTCDANPSLTREGITVYASITDALKETEHA